MRYLRRFFWRLGNFATRRQDDERLREEIEEHIALQAEENIRAGLSPAEARRQAVLKFGSVEAIKEDYRAERGMPFIDSFLQDIRFALRMLRRSPGFTAVAVLTLAIGLGASTAIFSVVYGIVFRPLPYNDPAKLVAVGTRALAEPASFNPVSMLDLKDWRSQNTVLQTISAYGYNRYVLPEDLGGETVRAANVSPEFFSMLGVPPLLGRELGPADERERVAVLGYELWQQIFHGNPAAIGKTLRLNDSDFQIVGVMPASFRLPTPDVSLWLSFADIYSSSGRAGVGDWLTSRSLRGYRLIGRLKDGVTLPQAQSQMDAIEARLGQLYPDDDKGFGVALIPLQARIVGDVENALLLFLGAVGFVLLIACVNVGNLLLAKAAVRRREIALRHALGAGSWRLTRQVLTESALLGVIGAALGILCANWAVDILLRLIPQDVPRLQDVHIDGVVMLFAVGVAVATTLVFGLAPARRLSANSLDDALRQESRGNTSGSHSRTRSLLVAGEIALATVLVAAAGLMLQSLLRLAQLQPVLAPERLLTFEVSASLDRYSQPWQQARFFNQILEKIRAIPSVRSAGACTSMPPDIYQESDSFSIQGRTPTESGQRPSAIYLPAMPGFFEALGLPLLAGRDFTGADAAGAPFVAIINSQIARRYFRGEDPVGQKMNVSDADRTIVGVVADTTYSGLGAAEDFEIYVPYAQNTFPGVHFAVRTDGDPLSLVSEVRSAIRHVDLQARPTRISTIEQLLSLSIVQPRFYAWLLTSFSSIALALAAIGIFGLVSYSVSQRTREIGIRMALGADRSKIMRLIYGQGLKLTLSGVAIGIASALAFNRLLSTLLFGVKPTDPVTFAGVALMLAVVSLLACYVPVRRAIRVDPMIALRFE